MEMEGEEKEKEPMYSIFTETVLSRGATAFVVSANAPKSHVYVEETKPLS